MSNNTKYCINLLILCHSTVGALMYYVHGHGRQTDGIVVSLATTSHYNNGLKVVILSVIYMYMMART